MIKKILTYPEDKEILSMISEDGDWEKDKELIQDLKDTLLNSNNGVGLSAIQIGVPKKIFVMNYGGPMKVFINPKITWERLQKKTFLEGCLSVPGKYVEIERPQKVICEYTDENGQLQKSNEGGWTSAIIQHEMDHFKGECQVSKAGEEIGR